MPMKPNTSTSVMPILTSIFFAISKATRFMLGKTTFNSAKAFLLLLCALSVNIVHPIVHADDDLPWWAANEEQIKNAPCKTRKAPSVQQMKAWLERQSESDDARFSQEVNGVNFKYEKLYYIKLFQDLNSYIWGSIRPITYETKCTDFYCAMADIYGGEKRSVQMAYILARYGYNTNPYIKPKSRSVSEWVDSISTWPTDHLDTIMIALGDFPRTAPITDYNRDLKLIDGLQKNTESIIANAKIYIFKPWLNQSYYKKQLTIVHEVGHNFDVNLSKRIGQDWSEVPGEAVSRYAKKNAAEDFAESVVGYRYNASVLKNQAPQKYEAIQKYVFDGVEYLSRQTCTMPSQSQKYAVEADNLYLKNQELIEAQFNSRSTAEYVAAELVKVCGEQFLSQQKFSGDYKYRRCITQNMRDIFGEYLIDRGQLDLSIENQVNTAMYKKIKLPFIFVLRTVTHFKVLLQSMVTQLITDKLYSAPGLALHLAGQFTDVNTFCSNFDFVNAYYQSGYARQLQVVASDTTVGQTVGRLLQNICVQIYSNKQIRTPVEKATILFAVDDYLE